jgi:predicted nucleic acid-binding Zn ribbon protein
MFCDQCGTALATGQQFCSRCGKEIIGPVQAAYARRSRVQDHVRLLGILWLAYSAFNAIAGLVLVVLSNTLFVHLRNSAGPQGGQVFEWLTPFLSVIGILVVVKAAAGFLAGWGLLQRESWGRTVALVMGFISLITNIPIGTALGIYTLWVLLPAQSDEEYQAMTQAKAAA